MARKENPISSTCYIYIDGKQKRLDNFTKEEQAALMEGVNKKGMEKLGYVLVFKE